MFDQKWVWKKMVQNNFRSNKILVKRNFWTKPFWSKEVLHQRSPSSVVLHQMLSFITCLVFPQRKFGPFLSKYRIGKHCFFIFVGIQLGGWQQILFPVWTTNSCHWYFSTAERRTLQHMAMASRFDRGLSVVRILFILYFNITINPSI